ncbi:hypothetical protein [Pseudolactococcus insecticola]|uniref:Lipoprotein n=1 Tax=Pseudolactococcus insecticola TaxID=2709158 RepID=A0A6A0B528_9LACT|nr:hypothetical protein [Lactococcus insecticola]GFH39805.1 lipoprotein [Lactococcus insecticola]
MKKVIGTIVTAIIALIIGLVVGSKFLSNRESDAVQAVASGHYTVKARWSWTSLDVSGDTWTLDGKRKYNVVATGRNMVVLQEEKKDTVTTYKVLKANKKIDLYTITDKGITKKVQATLNVK